jgi:O-antigen/teichoic acid export membrane protein
VTRLRRGLLTLMSGGLLAQALPLLLGPWLTRLYTPAEMGQFALFAAVAANLAVVACARYEFALPTARDAAEADALRRLCLRLLGLSSAVSLLLGAGWALWLQQAWPLLLGPMVGLLGWLSLATLWATRAQAVNPLAVARVLQHGGTALLQVLAGLLAWGVQGLVAAALAAVALAASWLRLPLRGRAANAPALREMARRHRDFPLLNTPHAFLGALQDSLALLLIAQQEGAAAAGLWGLALRYLKAPATLVGGALSQLLYPKLCEADAAEGRRLLVRVMGFLLLAALPLVLLIALAAPALFGLVFGAEWAPAGPLAQALALYIGLHFIASPLSVAPMAWGRQAWTLRLAVVGQVAFVAALALGLQWGGLNGAGWAVSVAMLAYFGYFFWRLPLLAANGLARA